MNLAKSQAHCSPANEIKATFAFLSLFNYISGRTVRARCLGEEREGRESGDKSGATTLFHELR